mgnify:CR=1 FL=1
MKETTVATNRQDTASMCLLHVEQDAASMCLLHVEKSSSQRPTVDLVLENLGDAVA